MDHITKTTKRLRINPYNGLNRRCGYNLEATCLRILNRRFKCICGLNCKHFPKIIACDPNEYTFTLSNCGYSLYNYKNYIEQRLINPITIPNMEKQIHCIIYNLKINNIKHLDVCLKNICINDEGIIALIDFDIACYNSIYISRHIKKREYNILLTRQDYSTWLKKRLKFHLVDQWGCM